MLFSSASRAINKALATDPATLAKLQRLQGEVFCVESTLPPLILSFHFTPRGVEPVEPGETARVRLRGTALALVRLLVAAAVEDSVTGNNEVEILGDATALLQLSRAFADLEIDWEELLSQLVGDLAARALTEGLGQARRFGDEQGHRLTIQLQNFAHQSLGLSRPEEIQPLAKRSRELQYRLDRLEARLRLAEKARMHHAD